MTNRSELMVSVVLCRFRGESEGVSVRGRLICFLRREVWVGETVRGCRFLDFFRRGGLMGEFRGEYAEISWWRSRFGLSSHCARWASAASSDLSIELATLSTQYKHLNRSSPKPLISIRSPSSSL